MKITKGMFALLCSFVAAAMLIAIGNTVFIENNQAVYHGGLSHEYEEEKISSPTTVGDKNEKYLIREYHGAIGVFGKDGTLIKTVSVAVVALPLDEREKLENGFYAESDEMLKKIIEDYTG